jgi:hypothetical protein
VRCAARRATAGRRARRRAARTQQPVATVPVTMAYAIQTGINAAVSGMKARAAAPSPSTIAVDSAA